MLAIASCVAATHEVQRQSRWETVVIKAKRRIERVPGTVRAIRSYATLPIMLSAERGFKPLGLALTWTSLSRAWHSGCRLLVPSQEGSDRRLTSDCDASRAASARHCSKSLIDLVGVSWRDEDLRGAREYLDDPDLTRGVHLDQSWRENRGIEAAAPKQEYSNTWAAANHTSLAGDRRLSPSTWAYETRPGRPGQYSRRLNEASMVSSGSLMFLDRSAIHWAAWLCLRWLVCL